MSSLAIISSPLQLLSLGEYIYQNNLSNYKIIILYYNDIELKQINKVNEIYKLDITRQLKGFKFLQYFKLKKTIKKYSAINEIILGNFFSDPHLYLMNLLSSSNVTIIDDGMVVHRISSFLSNKKRILKQSRLKQIIFSFFNINVNYPENIKLFTIFDVKANERIIIQKNKLLGITSKIEKFKISDSILIIGQPFVELNILSKEKYQEYLRKIIKKYNQNVYYFPSRKESQENLKYIDMINQISILKSDYNIELYLLEKKLVPNMIVGFTTTALVTLNKLFNNKIEKIKICSFKLDIKNHRFSEKFYENIYDNLKLYGINCQTL